MNEIGYHGTCSKYLNNIRKNGLDPAKCKYRSDHWLGQGVYFFDDYDKADWWATITSAQHSNCGRIIFQSNIVAPDEKVLNLDDRKQYDNFLTEVLKNIKEIEKCCSGKMPIFNDDSFRAVFFDYFKEQYEIEVIIATFIKDFAGYNTRRYGVEKEMQKQIMDIIGIGFKERQICVSKEQYIKSTLLIYNESEEVV